MFCLVFVEMVDQISYLLFSCLFIKKEFAQFTFYFLFSFQLFQILWPTYFKFNDFTVSTIIAYLSPLEVLINLLVVVILWSFKSVHLRAPGQSCLLVKLRRIFCHDFVIVNLVICSHCWESDAKTLMVSTNHFESNIWIGLHIFQTIDVVFLLVINDIINEVINWRHLVMIFVENITHYVWVFIYTFTQYSKAIDVSDIELNLVVVGGIFSFVSVSDHGLFSYNFERGITLFIFESRSNSTFIHFLFFFGDFLFLFGLVSLLFDSLSKEITGAWNNDSALFALNKFRIFIQVTILVR